MGMTTIEAVREAMKFEFNEAYGRAIQLRCGLCGEGLWVSTEGGPAMVFRVDDMDYEIQRHAGTCGR